MIVERKQVPAGAVSSYHRSAACATLRAAMVTAGFILILIVSFVVPAAPAAAEGLPLSEAQDLGTSGFVWSPQLAQSGPLAITIDLGRQRAFVFRGNVLIGISTISSGVTGHETPAGTYAILEKRKLHHSNEYDDAPMPYMERLTWDGLAMHGGYVKGVPDSHGCIRLPRKFAGDLFKVTHVGTKVTIVNQAPQQQTSTQAPQQQTSVTQ